MSGGLDFYFRIGSRYSYLARTPSAFGLASCASIIIAIVS
jgi:hypothetical protein